MYPDRFRIFDGLYIVSDNAHMRNQAFQLDFSFRRDSHKRVTHIPLTAFFRIFWNRERISEKYTHNK